jgi:L-aminopeptidase/D-esterase
MARARLRELGITIGALPTGTYNAITDVPGVLVGQTTLISDKPVAKSSQGATPSIARTGVTMIVPRNGTIWTDHAFAGYFNFNGCGEMSGQAWIAEAGVLHTPIGITNTNSVGIVRDAIAAYPLELYAQTDIPPSLSASWQGSLPVVAETWDGWLNDINAFHITKEHAFQALKTAQSGPVAEGNVGGGTGMICHEFKGGTGTSSRLINYQDELYTVGVLVQTNYGDRRHLQIAGVPVGQEIGYEVIEHPWEKPPKGGSIIVIIATDAPLLPIQCSRLARRATVGLAHVGGMGHNGSGDLFLAFSTGNHLPITAQGKIDLQMIPHDHLDPFFEAVAEATEEAILNALTAAETMTGWQGHTAYALPLKRLQEVMRQYNRLK